MDVLIYREFLETLDVKALQDYIASLDLGAITAEELQALKDHLAALRVRKIQHYLMIFGFLRMLLEVLSSDEKKVEIREKMIVLAIDKPEWPPEHPDSYLVWVAHPGACPECEALQGKIYGVETDEIPQLHPNCVCELVRVYFTGAVEPGSYAVPDDILQRLSETQGKVKAMRMSFANAGAIRAVIDGDRRFLEVLAAPFGGPGRRDKLAQYFTKDTDFMLALGDRRPTLYFHGFSPQRRMMEKPRAIGVAEATKIDAAGLWMKTELDNSELSRRTWEAALQGRARASTGSVNYLERHNEATGEVLCWPIAELSVFDVGDRRQPVSDDAVVMPLRAIFESCDLQIPKAFEAGEDKNGAEAAAQSGNISARGVIKMDEVQQAVQEALAAERAAIAAEAEKRDLMKKSIIDELKGDPQYRAVFATRSETAGTEGMSAEEEETHAFLWNLRHPTQAPKAYRVLEESEALEGGPLVPIGLLNRIIGLRDETSLVTKMGIERLSSESLVLNVPRENAGMAVFATIAEEGAYVANEPAFENVATTVLKKGSMITITEEMAEDSKLFESYFVKLCGRKWGLTENLELFTKLKATATAGIHSATFTDAELMTFFFALTDPWRDGAHIIMANQTVAAMRALLIATPRAYGEFPAFGGGAYPSWMGVPLHMNSNWEAIGGGDTTLTASFVNPDALVYVERRSLSIKVDPYGDALNGRIRYFPSYRAVSAVVQVLGNVSYTDHA